MASRARSGCALASAFAICFALLLARPALAAPVVLLGDSWGVLIGPSVRSTLDTNGYAPLALYNGSVGGSRAAQWNADAFGTVSQILAPHPDARLIHLIVGGNDLLAGTADPVGAITATIANTVSFLGRLAAGSSVPILFSGYDYLPYPPPPTTPASANLFLDSYVNGIASAVSSDPLLASRVTVLNTHGLMQVHFGVPQNGLPPFDPSLPNANLPGPTTAFADQIHLTRAGYDVLAQELFTQFYQPVLAPEPGTALLVLLGVALPLLRRAKR